MKRVIYLFLVSLLCIACFTSCKGEGIQAKSMTATMESDAVVKTSDQTIKCHVKSEEGQPLEILITEPEELNGMSFEFSDADGCTVKYKDLEVEMGNCDFPDASFARVIKDVINCIKAGGISEVGKCEDEGTEYLGKVFEKSYRIISDSSKGKIKKIISENVEINFN